MAIGNRGLGKGLDALLKGYNEPVEKGDVKQVPVAALRANPEQPRRTFNEDALEELAESIRSQGVLQPILVRPSAKEEGAFEIIAGERRWRASKLAGLTDIPALVRDLSDEQSMAIALIENLQREDLNPVEEALGFKQLMEQFHLSQEEVARKVGKSRPAIANALRLLNLSDSLQEDIRDGRLSAGHARALLAVTDLEVQDVLRKIIIEEQLSVRSVEKLVQYWKENGELPEGTAVPEKAKKPRSKSGPLEDVLVNVQSRLAEHFACKAKIQGSEDKGKLVLSYSSKEEFEAIIERMGLQR